MRALRGPGTGCIVYDMRIHSNILTGPDIRSAAREANVQFTRFGEGRSRSHVRVFDLILTGSSRRHQNGGPDKAATWDEWGNFLAALFSLDAHMVAGVVKRPVYRDVWDFEFQTDGRFEAVDGVPFPAEDEHGDHMFRFSGTPGLQTCTKCTATRRWRV